MSNSKVTTSKVGIIGSGFVGASIAYALTVKNLSREIVLVDEQREKAVGEALDIQHGIPFIGISNIYAGDWQDCSDCGLIIICAGRGRKPGESRRDLAGDNIRIMHDIVRQIRPYYNGCPVMMVSNPNDILTFEVDRLLGMNNGVVFGTGCILDSSRFVSVMARKLSIDTDTVRGFVVGEHGEEQFPLWSRVSVAGIPLEEYCRNIGMNWTEDDKKYVAKRVLFMGADIIAKKGKTHYGIATCVCFLTDVILNKRQNIASVTSPLHGEYGINGVALSLPSIIGANGVEKRLEEHWSDSEIKALKLSAEKLKKLFEDI